MRQNHLVQTSGLVNFKTVINTHGTRAKPYDAEQNNDAAALTAVIKKMFSLALGACTYDSKTARVVFVQVPPRPSGRAKKCRQPTPRTPAALFKQAGPASKGNPQHEHRQHSSNRPPQVRLGVKKPASYSVVAAHIASSMATTEQEALQRALTTHLQAVQRNAGQRAAFRHACELAQKLRQAVNGVLNNSLEGRKQRVPVGNAKANEWRFEVRLHNGTVLSCSTPLRKSDGTLAVWYEVRIKACDESGCDEQPEQFDNQNDACDFVVQQVRAQANSK